MDSPTATLIGILKDRVESLRAAGDLNEALHAANATLEKTRQALGPDLDNIDAYPDFADWKAISAIFTPEILWNP